MRVPTKITNIVITTQVTDFINLEDIANKWKHLGVQYNKKKFPDLIFRLKIPKCTVLMFRSGKIVAEGCQFSSEGIFVLRKMARLLRDEGYLNARCSHMIIQNVVGDGFFDFKVNLQKLGEKMGEYCVVRKNFPGGIMKELPELLGTTVLIFWTGAILVTGGSSTHQVRDVVKNIEALIIRSECVMLPGETKEGILIAAGSRALQDIPKSARRSASRPQLKDYNSGSSSSSRAIIKINNGSLSSSKKIHHGKDVKRKRKRSNSNNIVFE